MVVFWLMVVILDSGCDSAGCTVTKLASCSVPFQKHAYCSFWGELFGASTLSSETGRAVDKCTFSLNVNVVLVMYYFSFRVCEGYYDYFCYQFPDDGDILLPSDHSTSLIYNMFSLACLLIFDTSGAPQRHTQTRTQICSLLHLADCLIIGTFCTCPIVHILALCF